MKLGFFSLLTLIMVTLKLCGVIQVSWWLVLLPVYAPIAGVLAILGVLALCVAVIESIESKKS